MASRWLTLWQGSVRLRLAVTTTIALGLWSCWAYYANSEHGMKVAMIAGLAQGVQSALSTFFGSAFIEWLFVRLRHLPYSVPLITLLSTGSSFVFMFSVHYVLGTPEIMLTIAPVITMALFYCFFYALSLTKPATMTDIGSPL